MRLPTPNLRFLILPAFVFLALPVMRADVTLRYQTEMKPSAALQPLLEAFMKNVQTNSSTSVRMKGNKGYTTVGAWAEIIDFAKSNVMLLDPAKKDYAELPLSQLVDKMTSAMPQASSDQMAAVQKAMDQIKSNVDSKMTGKTAEIQGIQAEEREITLTMDLPMPATMQQSGPSMKLVMHIWTAKKEEAMRVPAIRELTGYYAWQKYMVNPAGMLEKMSGKIPGMSKLVGPMLEDMMKNPAVVLRTHMEMYMPFLATVAKQMAAKGQTFPDIDPNAPLFELNQEVAELSIAPVDASFFEVPKDYAPVSADDFVRDMVKEQNAPVTGTTAKATEQK